MSEVMTGTWEALKEGRADLILAIGEGPAGTGYKAIKVGTLEFAFCVGRNHPLAIIERRNR
jgi:DNA-binding transcriptional LysR family regulator